VFDEAAQALTTLKVLTTPANPGAEIMTGLDRLRDAAAIDPKDIESFVHGPTIGVNTVIQRKGARMALFATENFSDVLEVARLRMAESYSLFSSRPEPLITRERVFGVSERLNANGGVLRPLRESSVLKALAQACAKNVDGIIVSLLHGFRNPTHEQAVAGQVKHRDASSSCLGHALDLKGMFGNPRRLCTEGTQRLCSAIEKNNAPDPVKYSYEYGWRPKSRL
jgi:N-methylhydantoinase A